MSTTEEKTEHSCDKKKIDEEGCYVPKRLVVVGLSCIGMVAIHSMRVGLSITVVTILDESPHERVGTEKARENLPNVDWDSTMIGFLHSIFYVGFILTQIPGGFYAAKMSGHKLFGAAVLLSSVLNLTIPVALVDVGYIATCAIRFLQGLCEGFAIPAVYRVLRDWSPTSCVSRYGGWVFAGMFAGPIVGFPVDGAITHYSRWEFVFFLHGGVGVIWFFFWFLCVYESPRCHPTISTEEKELILEHKTVCDSKAVKIPWKEIFLSTAFWAVMVSHFVKCWIFYLMLTNEPVYLNQFHFSLLENGIFSALPHSVQVITTLFSGYLAELMMRRLSKTFVRKFMTCFGFLIKGIFFALLYFVFEGHWAVTFLTLGIGLSGVAAAGWQINHLDLAPDFASVLAGISSAFGTIGGILSPALIGIMTHPQTLENWQKAFLLNAGILAFGALFYGIFGSGELQPWAQSSESLALTQNDPPKSDAPRTEKNEKPDKGEKDEKE